MEDQRQFLASLGSASHVALYLRKPIPEVLFQSLTQLGEAAPREAVEVIVEDLPDIGYLKSLHDAKFAILYGVGLPPSTTILIDRQKGFQLDTDEAHASWRLVPLKNGEDLSLTMIWHKFGLGVSLRGTVRERNSSKGLFCVTGAGQRQQWCRFASPTANLLPEIGDEVDIFGWEKWYSGIIDEVLQLQVCNNRESASLGLPANKSCN